MLRVTSFLRMAAVAMGISAGLPALAAGPVTTPSPTSSSGGHLPANPAQGGSPQATAPAGPAPGCLRPGVPLCMDDGTTFVSADKMSGCQSEVKEYVDKTMAYLKCLNDENITTGRDSSRNVDRFNCRLSGRKGCN